MYPALFWIGFVALGSLLPAWLLFHPRWGGARGTLAASALVVLGAFAFLYVFIIGGQAYPLDMLPGFEMRSAFGDGQVAHYRPSVPELMLGLGGVGAAFVFTAVGMRALDFLPQDDLPAAAQPAPAAKGG